MSHNGSANTKFQMDGNANTKTSLVAIEQEQMSATAKISKSAKVLR